MVTKKRVGKRDELERPVVTCRHCGGSGELPLDPILFMTLQTLYEDGPGTAKELHSRKRFIGVGVTAVSNRLSSLLTLGLVARSKRGRCWVYSGA